MVPLLGNWAPNELIKEKAVVRLILVGYDAYSSHQKLLPIKKAIRKRLLTEIRTDFSKEKENIFGLKKTSQSSVAKIEEAPEKGAFLNRLD